MLVPSLLLPLTLALTTTQLLAANADDWRGRSIYQVMTDRFARTDGSTSAACTVTDAEFCGGSWQGIENQLDYIQGMNFSAIWISPVIEQLYGDTYEGEGYHGYWPKNLNALNPNFGTADDLTSLITAVHNRGMYIMVDIVVNHFASWGDDNIDFTQFTPFNNEEYFHPQCWIDWSNQTSAEQCWMGDGYVPLCDVDTENDYVVNTLESWINDFVKDYDVDGLRLDAAKSIRKDFWPGFMSASGVYGQGEAWFGDVASMCPYTDYLDGVHNYVMKTSATSAISGDTSISDLADVMNDLVSQCKDVSLLGSFMENHDNARMASVTSDTALLKTSAALTVLSGNGIPIVFYGQEQMLSGTSDPYNRPALWLTGFPTGSDKLYSYFATLNTFRNTVSTTDSDFLTAQPTYAAATSNVMSVRKGNMMFYMSNGGSSSSTVSLSSSGWSANAALMDVLGCQSVTADGSGHASVQMSSGLPVALYPTSYLAGSGICSL